jgi:formiminoglutamate deiminase
VKPGTASPPEKTFWCETALIDGLPVPSVRVHTAADGRIAQLERGVPTMPGDVLLGTVIPGAGNAHSHAFHRALRGRTHAEGGDFWRWRESMYAAASALDPGLYYDLAVAVFSEMLVTGWTAVGEFHYVHHRPDGSRYDNAHAMELAIASAARRVGIRLTLLDTCYLTGGIGQPLSAAQRRFGDGTASGWLRRWEALQAVLRADSAGSVAGVVASVTLGAALHSVRAVPKGAMREILAELPPSVPLHIHLSEQPQENADCLAEYRVTPTGLLHELGALTPRLSVVHATHLTADDIALLAAGGATVVMCPTTEADLGDGIGPARALGDAGARIALGSDQNAVVDPLLEARGLEAGERLASGRRGRFSPAELTTALTANGYASLGLGPGGIREGAWCDLVEIDRESVRTVGSAPEQLALVATAEDVQRVVVGGRVLADRGRLMAAGDGVPHPQPAQLLRKALAALDARIAAQETP